MDAWLAATISGILLGGFYVVSALGLSLVFGVMRLVNIAHGELLLLGAYLSSVLLTTYGVDPFLGLLVTIPLLFALGYAMQGLVLNRLFVHGTEAPMLAAFGFSVVAQNLYTLTWTGNARSIKTSYSDRAIDLGLMHAPQMLLVAFAAALLLVLGLHLFLQRTMTGKAIRAAAQSPQTAEVMGINVKRIYALTYGIGAAIAAVGGLLVGMVFSFVPSGGVLYLLKGFIVVVLGGMGSVGGTLAGGLVLGLSESLGAKAFGTGYKDLVALLVFLLVLTLRPQGLFGRK